MIYLMKKTTSKVIGSFDTISLANHYLTLQGVVDFAPYMYLRRVEDMKYLSRVRYVDGICVYNNKDFWLDEAADVFNDYENHTVLDFFGGAMTDPAVFDIEKNNNCMRLNSVYTTADEVAYNIEVGFEFISLFREQCILTDLGDESGLTIMEKTKSIVPLISTGSFKEAIYILGTMGYDTFFTAENIAGYVEMLTVADVIVYLR